MKNIYNQIYWYAEELKSYTDLSGDRFDIDHAQRRLWKMIPILKANDLPLIQKKFDKLDELLTDTFLFDQSTFSQRVNQLFSLLEEKRDKK